MFRSGLNQKCPGLKLACVPHIGHFNDGQNYQLAHVLGAVQFMREPHTKIPSEGFDLLMRRNHVMDVEVYLALYDMQNLREWLYKTGRSYIVSVIFHAWLFPQLLYRSEAEGAIEVAIFGNDGVFPMVSDPTGLMKGLRRFDQRVWVKDKIYMCLGPDAAQCRVDRHRLICTFWSLGVPSDGEHAIVTKHVLVNETCTHISREVADACSELNDASVACVLQHLQKLLATVENATHRLSLLMGRCESAFEGVYIDGVGGPPHTGATHPMDVWEEQLALLDRSVHTSLACSDRSAPLLSDMIRLRVYEDLGRRRRTGKFQLDDQETIAIGEKAFLADATGCERAQAAHRVLIECIHDLEHFSESNSEMLAVDCT